MPWWTRLRDWMAGGLARQKDARIRFNVVVPFSQTGATSMKTAMLVRDDKGDQGVFGTLRVNHLCFQTLELPERGNLSGVSCIPAGTYQCNWEDSPRLGRKTYRLVSVPGRSGILFHAANFAGDTAKGFKAELNGCIALGLSRGVLNGQKALVSSRDAMTMFEGHLKGGSFMLTIV